jgi:hypothetical protein
MQLLLGVLLAAAWAYNFKCWGDGVYTIQRYFSDTRDHNREVMKAGNHENKKSINWTSVLKQSGFIALDIIAVLVVRSLIGITKDALIPSAILGTIISFSIGILRSDVLPPYSIMTLMIARFKKDSKDSDGGGMFDDIVRDFSNKSTKSTVNQSSSADVLNAGGKSYVIQNGKAYEIQR